MDAANRRILYLGDCQKMKVAIFGLGYVGFTAACCIAKEGHTVVGYDVSESKVQDINSGIPPFAEPGLDEMLKSALYAGLINAKSRIDSSLEDIDVAIVCVGTPSGPDGSHNMSYIADVTRQIAVAVKPGRTKPLTVAYRSTFRPGTVEQLVAPIFKSNLGVNYAADIELVYNPEFLRESVAVFDYFNPPKIVIGTCDCQPSENMNQLHANLDAPVFYTGYREAEFTKFVDNTWHAVKVAYANEIGRVCQKLGISASKVHEIFVSDTKLNISSYYTRPGGAFGGSCLPKDVRALQHIATDVGANTHLVDSLLRTNEAHKNHQFEQITAGLQSGAKILMVGLAFKADTDDLRESPNVDLARKLLQAGYELSVFDPALIPAKLKGQNLGYAYAHLPSIDTLLISREEAESGKWERIIASNATIKQIVCDPEKVIPTHMIP
jgi:GDP-mannose 6-dehydrogenase